MATNKHDKQAKAHGHGQWISGIRGKGEGELNGGEKRGGR